MEVKVELPPLTPEAEPSPEDEPHDDDNDDDYDDNWGKEEKLEDLTEKLPKRSVFYSRQEFSGTHFTKSPRDVWIRTRRTA